MWGHCVRRWVTRPELCAAAVVGRLPTAAGVWFPGVLSSPSHVQPGSLRTARRSWPGRRTVPVRLEQESSSPESCQAIRTLSSTTSKDCGEAGPLTACSPARPDLSPAPMAPARGWRGHRGSWGNPAAWQGGPGCHACFPLPGPPGQGLGGSWEGAEPRKVEAQMLGPWPPAQPTRTESSAHPTLSFPNPEALPPALQPSSDFPVKHWPPKATVWARIRAPRRWFRDVWVVLGPEGPPSPEATNAPGVRSWRQTSEHAFFFISAGPLLALGLLPGSTARPSRELCGSQGGPSPLSV